MIHDLKIWPEYFEAVRRGLKNFEIRKNDRGFQIGETLLLREYNPNTEEFSGKSIMRRITYIVEGPPFMAEGMAVLGMCAKESISNQLLYLQETDTFKAGYRQGYANGCDDTEKLLMGTGTKTPVGILNGQRRHEEPIPVRAERMIYENQERVKGIRNGR